MAAIAYEHGTAGPRGRAIHVRRVAHFERTLLLKLEFMYLYANSHHRTLIHQTSFRLYPIISSIPTGAFKRAADALFSPDERKT